MFYNKQYKKIVNQKKAFTLVEVMVAILLTSIVLTAAYMIWSRVQQRVARSVTKQTLQNELRKAANYMQNDFKSIKYYDPDGDDKDKALSYSGDDKNFSLTFEKFKEQDDKKEGLAQDSTEKVTYKKTNSLLTREIDGKEKILSVHCDGIDIKRTTDVNEFADEDFKQAKQAKLDIEITGKMNVPGNNEEMFHVEKTSVVMRNEYSINVNKTYKSNFDLQKENKEDVTGVKDDANVFGDKKAEDLENLPLDVLNEMSATEKEMLENAKDNIDKINESIGKVEADGVNFLEAGWYNFKSWFTGENDYTKFEKAKKDLEKADSINRVNEVVKDIKSNVKEQEKTFYTKAYANYNSLNDEDKAYFKRAYDMKVHDKTVADAIKKSEEETGEKVTDKPMTNKELLENSAKSDNEKQKADSNEVLKWYNAIDIDSWMSDDDNDISIYKANKSLLEQADTKIELLKIRDKSQSNYDEIEKAKEKKKI